MSAAGFQVSATSYALGVSVSRPPGDAPDAHRVEQRARGAVDFERAAAPRHGSRTTRSSAPCPERKRYPAPMSTTRMSTASDKRTQRAQRRRLRGGARCRAAGVGMRHVEPSERETHGKLHAYLAHVLPVGDVQAERAERRADAGADAIA